MAMIDFTTVPRGVPLTEDAVQQLHDRSAEVHASYLRRIESIQQTLTEAKARFNAEADDFVKGTPPESRTQAAQLAKHRLAQQVIRYQRSLVESSAEWRGQLLGELRDLAARAEAISAVARAPISLLGKIGLGEPRRTNLIQQLAGAGPAELESLARQAVMTEDLILGSAIAAVVGSKAKADQPFSPVSLAERMVGEQHARMADKLKRIAFNLRQAEQADSTFATGKARTIDSIALALARREIEPVPAAGEAL